MDNLAPKTQPMWRTAVAVFALAFLVQAPLIFNAGYFSHDELQWAAFADLPANQRRPLWDWAVLADFQYRPLTFELWMGLSRYLFAFPPAFHAVLVAWGAVNASMLAALARGLGVAARPAAFGALAFVLGPYAVYVHGWVGTIADLIWGSCALLIGIMVVRMPPTAGLLARLSAALAASAMTAVALTATTVAAAWSPAPGWGRAIIVAVALVNVWHGVNVMRQIRDVGRIQAEFSPALAEAVKSSAEGTTLRLKIAPKAEEWIFQRLTSHIPRYRGVAIGDRVRLVGDAEPADYLIEADGRLIPIR